MLYFAELENICVVLYGAFDQSFVDILPNGDIRSAIVMSDQLVILVAIHVTQQNGESIVVYLGVDFWLVIVSEDYNSAIQYY